MIPVRLHAALLLPLVLVASGSRTDRRASPQVRTGTIEGQVVQSARPAQRVAERYAGGAPASDGRVQDIPAVVYVQGSGLEKATVPGGRERLAQRDTTFVPAALAVTVGTTVEFPNQDPFFHNVFSYSKPKRFDLGRYPRGESKSVVFDATGVVRIYCEVHKTMRSMVVVVPHAYHATADAEGRFLIRGVPAGRHEIVVVSADRGTRTVPVTVEDGGTARVTVTFP